MDEQILFETYKAKYAYKSEAIFHALKDAIVSGRIVSGTKLPASRKLAVQYGLSRGTVNVAYEMLHSQGYVRTLVGSGTYVFYHSPTHHGLGKIDLWTDQGGAEAGDLLLSEWGRRMNRISVMRVQEDRIGSADGIPIIDFSLGKVDLREFPQKEWNRVMFKQVRHTYEAQRGDAFRSEGHGPLRESIAQHLRRTRGLSIRSTDVAIVNGSQQALTLLIQLLINPGDEVWTEDPLYGGVIRAVKAAGGTIRAFSVDRQGIVFEPNVEDAGSNKRPKLLILTPSRQFPTGAVLPMERRLQLLEWAEKTGAILIEDDYDSEFRFKGRPIEPLKALDQIGCVVYIGTFSRTMLQDIRIGYAVLPPSLSEPFIKAKQIYEPHPSSILEQRALAQFMSSGQYEKHLNKMRRIYKRRAELLTGLIKERLSHLFDSYDSDAGLHIYAEWRHSNDELDRYLQLCERCGVRLTDTRGYHLARSVPSVSFGFAHLDEWQIQAGIERLVSAASLLTFHP